jgi:hypothetical protein
MPIIFKIVMFISDTKNLRVPTLTLKRKCRNCGLILDMIRNFAKKGSVRMKICTRENWGDPFILGFMLLLMVAAVSLSIGVADVANEVAIYAYYALVGGFVLQLVCFLRYKNKNGEKNHESN